MKTKLLFVLISVGLLAWTAHRFWPVSVKVDGENPFEITMPLKDKKRLEQFFVQACFSDAWGFTLMRSKPMSIGSTYYDFLSCSKSLSLKNIKTILQWKTWEKYQHHFNHSRFITLKITEPCCDSSLLRKNLLILIDKVKLEETVRQNLQDFEEVFQISIDPKTFAHEIQNRPHWIQIILIRDGLLGTVLGFGRDNSWAINQHGMRRMPWIYPNFFANPSSWFYQTIDTIKSIWGDCERDYDLSWLSAYVADVGSDETKKLMDRYAETKEGLLDFYQGKDVVEATLSLFNQI